MAGEKKENKGVVVQEATTPEIVKVEPKVEAVTPKIERVLTELQKITGKYMVKRYKKVYLEHMFSKEEDAKVLFSKPEDVWQPPMAGEKLVLTGLNKAQQEEFEKELNLSPGTLAAFNVAYWQRHFLKIKRDGGTSLDCDSNIMDKLNYCLILAESRTGMPKFSMSRIEAELNPFCEFIVESAEKEAVQKNKALEVKRKAFRKLEELSLQDQMDFLTVYDQGKYKASVDNKPDFILSLVGDIIEKSPAKFLETLEDPHYKEQLFLFKCIRENVITKSGAKYFTKSGDLLGNTLLEAVLNLKDPEYNHIKLELLSKLEK